MKRGVDRLHNPAQLRNSGSSRRLLMWLCVQDWDPDGWMRAEENKPRTNSLSFWRSGSCGNSFPLILSKATWETNLTLNFEAHLCLLTLQLPQHPVCWSLWKHPFLSQKTGKWVFFPPAKFHSPLTLFYQRGEIGCAVLHCLRAGKIQFFLFPAMPNAHVFQIVQ